MEVWTIDIETLNFEKLEPSGSVPLTRGGHSVRTPYTYVI